MEDNEKNNAVNNCSNKSTALTGDSVTPNRLKDIDPSSASRYPARHHTNSIDS